jgi:hypothetical protein
MNVKRSWAIEKVEQYNTKRNQKSSPKILMFNEKAMDQVFVQGDFKISTRCKSVLEAE